MALEAIEVHLVRQYSQNVLFLASQQESRLRGTVMEETVNGEMTFWDQYGTVEMQERTTRFGDSPNNVTPRESRVLVPVAYETGEPVDSFDTVRMLNDPTNPIVRRHSEALGRQIDRTVINAGLGTALTGRKTFTSVPFPAGQIIAVDNHAFDSGTGDVGLTVGKLIATKDKFGMADINTTQTLHIACTQRQISNLLAEDKATSADYASIKALVNGEINSFMGFTFHVVTESLLPKAGNNRSAMAYTNSGIVLGMAQEPRSFIDRRSDKSFNWYAYFELFLGATRVEEAQVISILCKE